MYSFSKTVRNREHVRHYTIRRVESGWEVRAEQDNTSIHTAYYDDWHRVERAQRRMLDELERLTSAGWVEVGATA
jgi:hypothetical protein